MALVINQLIYLAFTIGMAYYHSRLIKDNNPIRHGVWAAIAVAVACLFGLINWLYIPTLIMLRVLVFSPALAFFRCLPLNYTSLTSTSIIDKLERKLFKSWGDKMAVYFAIFLFFELTLIFNS